MSLHETELITALFERLKKTAGQSKDPEAEALIRQAAAAQPEMPYYLVQTALIQELSLHQAQGRIAELERRLTEAKPAPAPAASFLGGTIAVTAAPSAAQPGYAAPPAVPAQPGYGASPAPGAGPGPGGTGGGGSCARRRRWRPAPPPARCSPRASARVWDRATPAISPLVTGTPATSGLVTGTATASPW